MIDKRDAIPAFNVIFKTADQQFPYANHPGHLDGSCKLHGGVQLSDRNFNNEQPGAGNLSQTGFDGFHGIK